MNFLYREKCSSTHFWGIVTLKSLVWRSQLCKNVENVIRDESTALVSSNRSEMNLLYQTECSSTHFWGRDFKILGFEGHWYVEMLQLLAEIDPLAHYNSKKSEINKFYQTACSSTHFWGSDFEILDFEGRGYAEMLLLLAQMNFLPLNHVREVKWICCTRQNYSSTHFWGIVTLKSLVWRSKLCGNVGMSSEMNSLPLVHVTEVKWICCTRQNVQVPNFEV